MINFPEIQQIICNGEKIAPQILQTKSRDQKLVRTRQIIMSFCIKFKTGTLKTVGGYFNKDHTTVLYACKKIDELTWGDKDFALKINSYDQQIQGKKQKLIIERLRFRIHLRRMITNGCPIRRETVVIYNKPIEK
jgi:hypothetical protein